MGTGIFIPIIIAIGVSYAIPITCICILAKQVIKLHQDLRETTREYKLYQAAVNKDYKTVGILRNTFAGIKDEPATSESKEEKENAASATFLTQVG